jgi:hypothetical protein
LKYLKKPSSERLVTTEIARMILARRDRGLSGSTTYSSPTRTPSDFAISSPDV